MRITTLCHAKVNLSLSVGPADASGYHPITTIFQTINLCDDLVLEPSSSGNDEVLCDWPGLPEANTLTKCIRLVRELHRLPPVKVTLTKRIPAQSGLGGGSSDAAGLLRCFQSALPDFAQYKAREVAVAIGADVPFFLHGGRAIGRGYGVDLELLDYTDQEHIVVVVPPVPVSTAGAYQALDSLPLELREDPPIGFNDFERVAPAECTHAISELARLGGQPAMLSGSGSAVFGVFEDESAARRAARELEQRPIGHCFVCRSTTSEESSCVTS